MPSAPEPGRVDHGRPPAMQVQQSSAGVVSSAADPYSLAPGLLRLPPATCGLALGLCGLGSLLRTLASDVGGLPLPGDFLCWLMLGIVAPIITIFSLRIGLNPSAALAEALDVRIAPAYGAYSMTLMYLSAWPVGALSSAGGLALLYAASTLATAVQLTYLAQHLSAAAYKRNQISLAPSCFPATVSCGLVPIIGAELHMSTAVRDVAFVLGFLVASCLTPIAIRNLVASAKHAASAEVWPLTAPWALLSVAWFVSDGGTRTPRGLGTVLPSISIAMFALTLAFAIRRRRAIARTFFAPAWVMFTFPSCTTSVSMLHMARRYPALRGAVLTISACTVLVVASTSILFACKLPTWIMDHQRARFLSSSTTASEEATSGRTQVYDAGDGAKETTGSHCVALEAVPGKQCEPESQGGGLRV
eukprot:CAMPEP_0183337212 /NCGR_PEP_ID=MMETSP0164_2-20130417/4950_1 /TAXON_ID=221442 /ORGANISM="Coccolithus pelagicus ssp braarudi, Strain PLY182g" /LENGTH=417 /DNA_ID=CAMNT_0025506879 /DNA_START=128 /DNA_END=1381 /DNA_ORIENTATION=+